MPGTSQPRGSSEGFRAIYQQPRSGAASYQFGDWLTDLKSIADMGDRFIANGDAYSGRHVGARIGCGGLGADNSTALIRVLLAYKVAMNGVEDQYVLRLYSTLTCTAGNMLGADGKRIADTITFSLGEWGTYLEAKTGARVSTALTVASVPQGFAMYDVPDLDNCDGLVLDTQISGGGASVSVNPLICLTT